MSAASRRKGSRFELEVANALKPIYPGARRGLQFQHGGLVPDVDGTPFWVECKVGKNPPLRPALEQAIRDCHDDRTPIAVVKQDRLPAIVLMRWADWLELAEARERNEDR